MSSPLDRDREAVAAALLNYGLSELLDARKRLLRIDRSKLSPDGVVRLEAELRKLNANISKAPTVTGYEGCWVLDELYRDLLDIPRAGRNLARLLTEEQLDRLRIIEGDALMRGVMPSHAAVVGAMELGVDVLGPWHDLFTDYEPDEAETRVTGMLLAAILSASPDA